MNVPSGDHPSAEQLPAFALGLLDPEQTAAIERHVAECDVCCQSLLTVPDDALVSRLREAVITGSDHLPAPPRPSATFVGAVEERMDLPAPVPPELTSHPRYRVEKLLGAGGMGAVYRAYHRVMDRPVALKVINPNLMTKPGMVERFTREVKAAARLSHPNIVTAFDAEQAGGTHFLVMEYVDGTDLGRLVGERGPLPVDRACDYVRQAALGLQHAFEQGMVHRDIKPHNLMLAPSPPTPLSRSGREGRMAAPSPLPLSPEAGERGEKRTPLSLQGGRGKGGEGVGRVKILDFGLARFAGEAASGGVTSSGMVLGTVDYIAPEQTDNAHEADIRSDIYSLGCTLYHLLAGQPPFPTGTALQKMMAHVNKNPQPLTERRDDLPEGLMPVLERMMAKNPKHRFQTPAEVAVALEPFTRATAVARAPVADPDRTILLEKTPAGDRRRRRFVLATAILAFLVAGLLGAAVYRIATDKGELVIKTDNDDVEVIVSKGGNVVKIIDARSGKQVTLKSGDYELELMDPPEGLQLSLYKFALKRGEQVLVTVERVPKPGPVGEVRRFEGHAGPVRAVAISRDGRYILSGSGFPEGDKTLRLWGVASGREIRQFKGHAGQVLSVAFSPDGRRALSGSQDHTIRLWDVRSGQEIRRFRGHQGDVFSLAFSPDGRYALSGSLDCTVRLWDVDSGDEVRQFEGHEGRVMAVAFSPDGRRAVSGSNDGTVRLWEVETGKHLRSYQGTPRGISCAVAWSPNGGQVVFGDGAQLALWDVETGKARVFGGGALAVAFSPDGRRVLSGGTDKVLRLWDAETGRELLHFAGHLDAIWSVAISADGRYALSGSGGQYRDGQWRPGKDWTIRLWRLPDPAPARKS